MYKIDVFKQARVRAPETTETQYVRTASVAEHVAIVAGLVVEHGRAEPAIHPPADVHLPAMSLEQMPLVEGDITILAQKADADVLVAALGATEARQNAWQSRRPATTHARRDKNSTAVLSTILSLHSRLQQENSRD